MKFLPVRCELHGILLLDAERISRRENHHIVCEGHIITVDTRDVEMVDTPKYLLKTRGLTEDEYFDIFGNIFGTWAA